MRLREHDSTAFLEDGWDEMNNLGFPDRVGRAVDRSNPRIRWTSIFVKLEIVEVENRVRMRSLKLTLDEFESEEIAPDLAVIACIPV